MYQDRVQKQAAGEFLPIVYSSGGMIGETAKSTIKAIAVKLSSKSDEDSKKMQLTIKTHIRFSFIRSRLNAVRNPKRSVQEQLQCFNSLP